MTEEIIIDGVNVAGCKNYCVVLKDMCAFGGTKRCSQIHNCYYKQLKHLEQENKENIHYLACMTEQRNKLKSALEEIKVISDNYNLTVNKRRKQIADKINEVLK